MDKTNLEPKDTSPRFSRKKLILFGKDSDSIIKSFFGSSATISIFVLALITIFLFKEGIGFMGKYHKSLQQYRLSGLEYVDILKENRDDYTELNRFLTSIKSDWISHLKDEGLAQKDISKKVMSPESKAVFINYMRAGSELKQFIKTKMDLAIEIRDQDITNQNLRETLNNFAEKISNVEKYNYVLSEVDRSQFILRLKEENLNNTLSQEEIAANNLIIEDLKNGIQIKNETRKIFLDLLKKQYVATENLIKPINYYKSIDLIINNKKEYFDIVENLEEKIQTILLSTELLDFENKNLDKKLIRFKELNEKFLLNQNIHKQKLKDWDQNKEISFWSTLGAFLTGKEWVTASDQQDWYGLLPLLSGSLLVSAIAMFFAIPLGVGAAIYTNQIASPLERNIIKPYIEFVSAIPSVVIGFFGVVVLGEALRNISQIDALSWIPFFPIQERLNVFTAGCLLALMAIPTIFTLAEDAINNVPKHLKEASLAIGATQLQTTVKVIVPSCLSAIISATMLGFGRVIGETMVVLLCAGNRIKIPDFTSGLGVFFEPVHTMTGIIAQEMGEVVQGSVHYRALFMVGVILFFVSMIINLGAQWIVKKYNKLDA